ncbi:MAG: sigma-54 dependent transcriptional regulator, partial [Myxococcota bacterium]
AKELAFDQLRGNGGAVHANEGLILTVAVVVQRLGDRKDKPFIRVNCAAIPPELIESELFGYEKGAFTGAVTSKPGRFELASGGSLFLDEIGEIPVSMQVKLLRAIQAQEFERVGGIKTLRTDIRLIAATNRDLREEIDAGRFREDLFYRLNVVEVHLPPLRERTEDIPLLLQHFLAKFNERLDRKIEGFTEAAEARLLSHRWRGNIRELENLVERCMLFCDDARIDVPHLPAEFREREDQTPAAAVTEIPEGGLKDAVRQASAALESALIQKALARTGGNVTHAARLLKISRKSLQTKMKELGLR